MLRKLLTNGSGWGAKMLFLIEKENLRMPTTTFQAGKYKSFSLSGPFVGSASSGGGATSIGHPPPTTQVAVILDSGVERRFPLQENDTVTLTAAGDLVIEQVQS
jgi:hypothetical protein